MAAEPVFAVTPRLATAAIATADSSLGGTSAPTTFATLLTGVAAGTRITEVVAKVSGSGASTAAIVRLFLFDGTTYILWDELVLASATGSASVATTRNVMTYNNLILPSSSWSLRATVTALASGHVAHVTAMAADL